MRIPAKIVGSLKLSAVVLVALATFAQAAQFAHHPPLTPGDGLDGVAAKSATPGFKVTGHISGLYPGRQAKLVVAGAQPQRLRHLRAIAEGEREATFRDARGKNIKIKKFKGKHRVAAHKAAKIKLTLTMKPKAPDGCQAREAPARSTTARR